MTEIKEVREEILEAAQRFRIPVSNVAEQLDFLEKKKSKVKGVWAVDGWMWIALEQGTKFTWSGVVFSPITTRGEFGSWYIDEPVGATVIVKPEPRWKVTDEELQELRARRRMFDVV
jgi:hypothetical protein